MDRAPSWKRSRAAAVLATLILHLFVGYWWLQSWSIRRIEGVLEERLIWLPAPEVPQVPPPPLAADAPALVVAPITAPPLPLPAITSMPRPDWSAEAGSRKGHDDRAQVPALRRSAQGPRAAAGGKAAPVDLA